MLISHRAGDQDFIKTWSIAIVQNIDRQQHPVVASVASREGSTNQVCFSSKPCYRERERESVCVWGGGVLGLPNSAFFLFSFSIVCHKQCSWKRANSALKSAFLRNIMLFVWRNISSNCCRSLNHNFQRFSNVRECFDCTAKAVIHQ